jgi:hypothetical protein
MAFEHLDKPLPDDAGGTENSNGNFVAHILLVIRVCWFKEEILGILQYPPL